MSLQRPTSEQITFAPEGAGAVATKVESQLNLFFVFPENFGATGDGITDDTSAFLAAALYANSVNRQIYLTGKTYILSTLTLSVDANFIGTGTIRKKPGTTGHLIVSSANLRISGNITLDQNAANCPNPSVSFNTDCTINHSGDTVILEGITCLESLSSNLNFSSKKQIVVRDCIVTGGWICIRAVPAAACKVEIIGGKYSSSTVFDNIQILNTQDFVLDRVTSFDSYLSGIAVSNSASNGIITNCICYQNKIDPVSSQGGYGIVLSVLVTDVVVSNNVCYENERGSIAIDTTPPDGSTNDGRINVIGNICIGDYLGNYATTGININKANQVNIVGNYIKRATQSILYNTANEFSVSNNIIEDCGSGYFFQATSCANFEVSNNQMRNCIDGSAGAISIFSSTFFKISNNTLNDLKGASRNAFKFTNPCTDFVIDSNKIEKTDAGAGFMFFVAGNLTNARFTANKFRSSAAAWQYYIVATGATLVNVVTERNEIVVPSVQTNPNRYILNGAAIVADGDTINNIRDLFSAAPTAWTFRTGYMAVNNSVPQYWNGTAWVNI